MMAKNLAGRVMLLAASALMATLMSGCAGFQSNASAGSTTPAGNASLSTSTQASSAPARLATATTAATPDTAPKCAAASLEANIGGGGGGGTMHLDTGVRFTNIGSTSCVIQGFPGVSYVTGDNGAQVGAPADRDGAIGPPVTLAPGQTAHAPISMLNGIGAYSPDDPVCGATPMRGIRVFPPGDTAALFISSNNTVCGNPSNHTMTVRTIQTGDGVVH
jgi:hypothetical protein